MEFNEFRPSRGRGSRPAASFTAHFTNISQFLDNADFAPISFEVQWNDNIQSFDSVVIWATYLATNRARKELTRSKCE